MSASVSCSPSSLCVIMQAGKYKQYETMTSIVGNGLSPIHPELSGALSEYNSLKHMENDGARRAVAEGLESARGPLRPVGGDRMDSS